MKFVIVFAALIAIATAAPADSDAQVVRFDSDVQPNSFQYHYSTSNGINENVAGVLNNEGSDHESLAVRGYYSYVGDDGETYQVTYVADENGFQPEGAHLPVAP